MIISTPLTDSRTVVATTDRRGFSLTEVMVATTLSGIILAGVLSAFLMIGRTGYAASNYSEMEAQSRRALETFGGDARKATDVRWNSSQSVTLFVVTGGSASRVVTYAYDNVPTSQTYRSFYRVEGDANSTAPRLVLARNVESDLAFERFKLEQPGVGNNRATNDLETKQLQLKLKAVRSGATTVATSHSSASAMFLLRNKRVSN